MFYKTKPYIISNQPHMTLRVEHSSASWFLRGETCRIQVFDLRVRIFLDLSIVSVNSETFIMTSSILKYVGPQSFFFS
jgi:hypothetical protein